MSPRKSFAAWREQVRGRSRPWSAADLQAAEALRLTVLEVVLHRLDQVTRERSEAQVRQSQLVAELDHQVKNTLAGIRSLMRHSRKSSGSLDDYVAGLEQRIKAMAHTQSLLSEGRWRGADLEAVAAQAMAAHGGEGGAVTLDGPRVDLRPQAAVTLGMVLHELAANAQRHGALSAPGGWLRLEWRRQGDDLGLHWREGGGPLVAPPLRRGFGRMLIETAVSYELGGHADLRFPPGGVECDIHVPLARLSGPAGTAPPPDAAAPEAGARPAVLVVEDSMITAFDMADMLGEHGYDVVGPTGRVAQALAALSRERVDLAVLDINLGDEDSFPIADALQARGVPFLFLSGYDPASMLPPRFAGARCLSKPATDAALLAAVAEALARQPLSPGGSVGE